MKNMTVKKYTAVIAAAVMLFCMAGCTEIKQTTPYLERQAIEFSAAETTAAETTSPVTTTVTTVTETVLTGPEYSEIPLDVPSLNIQNVELTYQAEDMELPISFEAKNEKTDYTGSGYISGLRGDLQNTFIFSAEVPSSQHYDIQLVVCADEGAECLVTINGEKTEKITVESSSRFICATIPGIYMEAGMNSVSIQQIEGDMLIDCMVLQNNTSLSPNRIIEAVPSDENASQETRTLLEFLCDNYSKAVISGQHVSDSSNKEIKRIVETTGKYPAIRFADMYPFSLNGGNAIDDDTVSAAIEWSKKGGITGLMWHWFAPLGDAGTLEPSDEFSLAKAVTQENVAELTLSQLEKLEEQGSISEECVKIIEDIDSVAEGLKELQKEDIPVLWRPLHQAGAGAYWWDSEGSEAYLWLWDLMYDRMTNYHKLHNLLWVWSGVDNEYLPDKGRFDIASADVYAAENEEFGSGYEPFYALQKMAEGKLIALSECSSLPDIPCAFRDGCVWSYFGLWYEPYLSDEDNAYTDSETLVKIYNSEGVLTREDYIDYCSQAEAAGAVTEPAADPFQ